MRYPSGSGNTSSGATRLIGRGECATPFGGSGTVGYVAAKLKRDWLLIELNPSYAENIAAYKLQEAEIGVPATEAKKGQLALFPAGETEER